MAWVAIGLDVGQNPGGQNPSSKLGGGGGRRRGQNHRNSLSLSGGFTPCRHLRPSSGREHTIV